MLKQLILILLCQTPWNNSSLSQTMWTCVFRSGDRVAIWSPLCSVYISCQRLVLLYMPYRLLGMSMYTNAVFEDTPDATGFIFLNKMNILVHYQTITVKLRLLWHIHPFWMGWQQLSLKPILITKDICMSSVKWLRHLDGHCCLKKTQLSKMSRWITDSSKIKLLYFYALCCWDIME